jgi:hypothetical protein
MVRYYICVEPFFYLNIDPFHIKMKKYTIENNFIFPCIYGMLFVPLFQQIKIGDYNMKKETERIDKADVIKVAESIHIELTEKEIEDVVVRYPEGCANDPFSEWVLIVEQLVYDVFSNRNKNL